MRTPFKNPLNSFAPVFLVLMAIFVFGFGCNTSKPTPDPLAGWQLEFKEIAPTIDKDSQGYIQSLSPEEKKNVCLGHYYKDGTGQHAVEIIIGVNGRGWRHILIYDKDNKRIKTIKYATGYYAS
jgi:hypothetical protein